MQETKQKEIRESVIFTASDTLTKDKPIIYIDVNTNILSIDLSNFISTLLSEDRAKTVEVVKNTRATVEMQDLYKREDAEYTKRSLSGLLQVKLPIDTNKGYEFVYVTERVQNFILDLVNSELKLQKDDILELLNNRE